MGFLKMKKTLAALAVLGAFAGSAMAADVTLYGAIDQGLSYTYSDVKGFDGSKVVDGDNTFEMTSGIDTASEFGLKGVEDLGNGYKVGFKLENGVSTDDGTLGQDGRLFGREAALTVYGPFGELAFGRMGGIASSAGTYDLLGYVESFDGGDNAVWGFDASDRYDNMITYATPRVAGLQGIVQYSFKTDSKAERDDKKTMTEGESTAERYFSVGVTGEYGPAQFAAGYELTKYSTLDRVAEYKFEPDDHNLVFVGGNYDFGVAKLFAEAQYFSGARSIFSDSFDVGSSIVYNEGDETTPASYYATEKGYKGYGLHLGTVAPVAGGELCVGLYYVDATLEDLYTSEYDGKKDLDAKYYGLAARYGYELSERTKIYVGGGYAEATLDKYDESLASDYKEKIGNVYVGLAHTF